MLRFGLFDVQNQGDDDDGDVQKVIGKRFKYGQVNDFFVILDSNFGID